MKLLGKSIRISIVLLLICGIIYPLAMTGISQLLFNRQANGSMVKINGAAVGSELIGQSFTDARFFSGRVSAYNYNTYKEADKAAFSGVASGSANLAPSNPALLDRVNKDIDEFVKNHPEVQRGQIPADLLTSSGSGLDPAISVEAAKIQLPAISKATGISAGELENIIAKCTEGRQLGIFGEPRVNVLKANIEIAKKLGLSK